VVSEAPPLGTRLLLGAIAGTIATLPMTRAVRAIHRRLPEPERYPAPPRELIDASAAAAGAALGQDRARDLTLGAHYAFGAAAGAAVAAILPRPGVASGAAAGAAVWAGCYLGWIPAAGLLKPATAHPGRRNAMMIAAHLVWGGATALALRELYEQRGEIFAAGEDKDVRRD